MLSTTPEPLSTPADPSDGRGSSRDSPPGPAAVPEYAHIVMVVMDNHSQAQIVEGSSAPFVRGLGSAGLTLTNSVGIGKSSQPNYLALFSGSTQGISGNICPTTFAGPNLAGELRSRGLTFTGYSEDLPSVGYTGCAAGGYVRKHNPWVDFPVLPASVNKPFSDFPQSDFAKLPTVSIIVPDLQHDMQAGSIAAGDKWLRANLGAYSEWP